MSAIPLAAGGNDIDNDTGNGPGGKTEWEDALIKHKIWKPRPNLPREDDVQLALQDIRAQQDELAGKDLKQLEELEDEVEEDILEQYRRKRLEELKRQRAKERFGQVYRIGEPEFVQEVSEASKEAPVVVHLFSFGKDDCRILNHVFAEMAVRRKDVKFVTITYNEAIRNYPESATPTVLLYNNGSAVHQIVGLNEFGGKKINADCLEWVLAQHKLIETQLLADPRLKLQRQSIQRLGGGGRPGRKIKARDDSDDSDGESQSDSDSGSDF